MDFNELLKQAQSVKTEMEKTDEQLQAKTYINKVSAQQVEVVINGAYQVVSVKLADELMKDGDKEMIQDLLVVAINDCLKQIKEDKENSVKGLASQMGLPF
jgi:DNA-binding YbaB/EbfC family protein